MGFNQRLVCALFFAAIAGSAAAKDFYWNCTTADGIKYADATQCDKGDTGVRVMRAGLPAIGPVSVTRDACQAVPAYCSQPDYGVVDASTRTQAIAHFMRQKECAFLQRFPPQPQQRCVRPD
jgi:hypothetical protein